MRDGVLVIRGALDPATLAELNATFDERIADLGPSTLETLLNDAEDAAGYRGRARGASVGPRRRDIPRVYM
eukprot:SAG31_NODE_17872_length_655_cov_0.924460_1_plen_71_part_00